VGEDGRGVGEARFPKDVRVPVDQLAHQTVHDGGDVEPAGVGRHLRVKDDLQQQVAQLVTQGVGVVTLDGVQRLVGLFQQVGTERARRLLPVPRTPCGPA